MTATRRQLRRWVGGGLGERIDAVATADAGDTSTFYGLIDLQIPDSELAGREVWYAESNNPLSAANTWARRMVYDNVESTGSLTVIPEWPAASRAGDVIELYNARGASATILEIHDKIDELVSEISEDGGIITATTGVEFTSRAPILTCPADWIWLFGAEYQPDITLPIWRSVPPSEIRPRMWDSPATVEITGVSSSKLNRKQVRLIGATPLPALVNDDSVTVVDHTWLVDQAVAELRKQTSLRWGDAATALTLQQTELAEANVHRPRAEMSFPALGGRWRLKN